MFCSLAGVIPESWMELPLTSLTITNNQLSGIPDGIWFNSSASQTLQVLQLSYNSFPAAALPASIAMPQLQQLWCESCNLTGDPLRLVQLVSSTAQLA